MALTTAQAVEQAKKQLSELIERKPSTVIGVFKDEEGWHVSLEKIGRAHV